MRKPTIALFWVAGVVLTLVGMVLALQIPLGEWEAASSLQSPVVIPGFLLLIGGVANFIAWIGVLVLAGRIGAWGWFIGVLLFGTLALLIFLIFGPDMDEPDADYDDYSDYGGYGGDYGASV